MCAKTHPLESLKSKSKEWKIPLSEKIFAEYLDKDDSLATFRDKFCYPKKKDLYHIDLKYVSDENEECVYLAGHSLGLMPCKTEDYVQRELQKWKKIALQGHIQGNLPWSTCDEYLIKSSAKLVGAQPNEVAILNALTINLHLLLISFYQPTKERYKIMLEDHSFPSDHYCIESQIRLHKLDPAECMVLLKPREGEMTLRHEDILQKIEEEGSSIAVVMLAGVQYFTGQVFRMREITQAGHDKGCYVGFDLAHAIGNIPLSMHEWQVDFASWCTYKYLCSGPGGIAGLYVHERFEKLDMPKLSGWWSHRMDSRFLMNNVLELTPGANGYRISNPPGILVACLFASLEVYDATSMQEVRDKSLLMSAYFEFLLTNNKYFDRDSKYAHLTNLTTSQSYQPIIRIITPCNPCERGCQFSITLLRKDLLLPLFKLLSDRGIILDKREPCSLRFSFNPLYNRFSDIYCFIKALETSIDQLITVED